MACRALQGVTARAHAWGEEIRGTRGGVGKHVWDAGFARKTMENQSCFPCSEAVRVAGYPALFAVKLSPEAGFE